MLDSTPTVEGARLVATALLETLGTPFTLLETEVIPSASIGIIVVDCFTMSAEDVVGNAGVAMYDAKSHGPGSTQVYEPDMGAAVAKRLRLSGDLQGVVERQELVLCYQPLLELRTDRVAGFEALVRWDHPVLGLLPPSEFIQLARTQARSSPSVRTS